MPPSAPLRAVRLAQILGIDDSSNQRAIKRAYRQLSLKYHPDKFKGNDEMFVRITKAYEALTDEVARENFRKYGNPDGKQAMSVGIGLPAFLTDKDYQPIVLSAYIIIIVVGVPGIFYLLYLSCRGVEPPRMKRHNDAMQFVSVHYRQMTQPPFRVGKFRVTEAVAGMPDLQPDTQKALKGDFIAVEPKHVNELNEVISRRAGGGSALDSAGGIGGLMVAAAASGTGEDEPSLWPVETGEPEPVVPRSRVWNNVDAATPTPPPEPEAGVHVVPKVRLTGRPRTKEMQGLAPSQFIPPLVMDRNHSLLWAHMLRIPPSEPAHARLLQSAGGADSLQTMLMLSEQQLILAAQAAAQGGWKTPHNYLGRDPPSADQANAVRASLRHLDAPAAASTSSSGKKVVRKAKPASSHAVAKVVTRYAADDLEGRDKLDWADAVLDLHEGMARREYPATMQQRPADCLRSLLLAQRIAQAIPPTASPLAQIPALAQAGVSLDDLGKAALALALPADDDDTAADADAPSSPSAKPSKSAKPGAAKAKAKRKAKAKTKAPAKRRSKTDDPDDAVPGDEPDDAPAARLRSHWPEWLRLASRGWFRDDGELQAFASLTPEQRGNLLARNAVPPQVGAEVEGMIESIPRVSLEASATVKRYSATAARDPGQKPKEEFDPFTPAADGRPRRINELEVLHVDVVLRHENLGCTKPEAEDDEEASGAAAGQAPTEEEEDDDDDDRFHDDAEEEDDDDEEGDGVLLEEDGITVRKAKRKNKPKRRTAWAAKLRTGEANADAETPEPHAPLLDRPLRKAERWALFVCSDRGWILSLDPLWRETNRPALAVDVADATKAGVEITLSPRFLPGPGVHKLYVVAVCLDYAGLDVVTELGTVRLDVNRKLAKAEKRHKAIMSRLDREAQDEAVARARSLAEEEGKEEAGEADGDEDAEEGAEEEPHMFEELQTLMRPANQLDEEEDDDIE